MGSMSGGARRAVILAAAAIVLGVEAQDGRIVGDRARELLHRDVV